MKKRILTIVLSVALIAATCISFIACSGQVGKIDIPSYEIKDMTTGCYAFVYNEDPYADSDLVTANPEKSAIEDYVNEETFCRYEGIGFAIDTDKCAGEEFICAEIDIAADRDVKAVISFEYAMRGVVDDMEVEFKAGEKKHFSLEFKNPFVVKKGSNQVGWSGFSIGFSTNEYNNGSERWKEWAKTQYNISKIELGKSNESNG